MWFVVFILLCALNNHLSCLFALSCGLFGLFFQNKKTIIIYLGTCVIAVLLYLPHLSITIFQLGMGGIGHLQDGWLPVPDKWVLFSLIKTVLGTGYVWVLFVLLFFISMVLNKNKVLDKKQVLLLILFLFNYAIIHLYSVYKAPIFQNSVMLFSAPCFIWALAGSVKFSEKINLWAALIVSLFLIVQSVGVKYFFANAALNQSEFQAKTYFDTEVLYGNKNVEAVFYGSQKYFVVYYELKYKQKINYHLGNDSEIKNITLFKKFLKESKASYILLGEANPMQTAMVKEYFPFHMRTMQGLNINCACYSKLKYDKRVYFSEPSIVDSSDFLNPNNYEYTFTNEKLTKNNSSFVYQVDSLNEFSFSAKGSLNNVGFKEGQVILAQIKLQSKGALNDVSLNYSVTNKKDSTLFFGGSEISDFYNGDSLNYNVYAQLFLGSDFKKWINEECKIIFFVWNRGKKNFKLNSFQIKTVDYWPQRWSWWE